MRVVKIDQIRDTERDVRCPLGNFNSYRFVLERDSMGFSLHKTVIYQGGPYRWHYTHHMEACYCVSGVGVLENETSGERHLITPDTTYCLDLNDPHTFTALTETVLISVFSPPVKGAEVHREDGSYSLAGVST